MRMNDNFQSQHNCFWSRDKESRKKPFSIRVQSRKMLKYHPPPGTLLLMEHGMTRSTRIWETLGLLEEHKGILQPANGFSGTKFSFLRKQHEVFQRKLQNPLTQKICENNERAGVFPCAAKLGAATEQHTDSGAPAPSSPLRLTGGRWTWQKRRLGFTGRAH